MPKRLLERFLPHDCAYVHQHEPMRNQPTLPSGTIWQCPDCGAFWYRHTEHVPDDDEVIRAALHEVDIRVWRKITIRQEATLRKLIKQGFTNQPEIIKRMSFERSPHELLADPLDPRDYVKYMQDPKDWIS